MFNPTGASLARHSSNWSGCEQLSKCRTNCISRTAVDSFTFHKFLVYPPVPVAASPYLSVDQPAGNRSTRNDDRPKMPNLGVCGSRIYI
jgi:hypothetical protein